jgi:acid phosphatase
VAARSGFIAFGDFGGGPGQTAVASAMEVWSRTHRVDALVTTGDNVYERGEPSRFGAQLDRPYAELRRTRPLWVSLGNHDVAGGNGPRQLAHLGLPALPYARDLDGVRLLFLDANDPSAKQAAWLDRALAEPGPPLRVVLFHQPAWSCGPHGSTASVDAAWVPVIERHRVALVLNGHDHNYQRFTSTAGVTYVVTGGGGRQLYPIGFRCPHEPALAKTAVRYHFVGVEIRGTTLDVAAVAADGEILDRVSVSRG